MFTKQNFIETSSFESNDVQRNVTAILKELPENDSWHGRNVICM
jgi:hypothetical protein